jgi:hypothetical protein
MGAARRQPPTSAVVGDGAKVIRTCRYRWHVVGHLLVKGSIVTMLNDYSEYVFLMTAADNYTALLCEPTAAEPSWSVIHSTYLVIADTLSLLIRRKGISLKRTYALSIQSVRFCYSIVLSLPDCVFATLPS